MWARERARCSGPVGKVLTACAPWDALTSAAARVYPRVRSKRPPGPRALALWSVARRVGYRFSGSAPGEPEA